VIAATNRDLSQRVAQGAFREDLYYRLNVFPIAVPPLRARREDIPLLVWTFAKHFGKALGKPVERIPQETMEALLCYPWPGNIRELRNEIERAVILSTGSTLRVPVALAVGPSAAAPPTLAEAERTQIVAALEQTGWRVRGPAARPQAHRPRIPHQEARAPAPPLSGASPIRPAGESSEISCVSRLDIRGDCTAASHPALDSTGQRPRRATRRAGWIGLCIVQKQDAQFHLRGNPSEVGRE
jgi:hypothetical protein